VHQNNHVTRGKATGFLKNPVGFDGAPAAEVEGEVVVEGEVDDDIKVRCRWSQLHEDE
jgi:hypothetical protein